MYQVVGTIRSRAFRVLWMLEELGEPYEHVPAQPRSEQASEVNPAGKVPTLVDNGVAITDSTAIIQYLADKHGALTFPAGTIASDVPATNRVGAVIRGASDRMSIVVLSSI